jgi:3-deoxy-D-manno-octulosonic acid kinase
MLRLDYTADPALDAFVELRAPSARILVLRGYEAHVEVLGLAGDPVAGRKVGGGRAEHPLVELPGGEEVLVRRYCRGGAIRHFTAATYFLGRRSYHELWVTERARAAGVRVPVMLAAAERRRAFGYGAWISSRWIPRARDLAAWLPGRSPEEAVRVLEAVGTQIGMMHAGGVAHPDLNLRNVLVASGDGRDEVYLLDFDRGRVFPGPVSLARRRSDLLRLARSARKLGASIPDRGWFALRSGYGERWPAGLSLR